jgi:hypothetical protein
VTLLRLVVSPIMETHLGLDPAEFQPIMHDAGVKIPAVIEQLFRNQRDEPGSPQLIVDTPRAAHGLAYLLGKAPLDALETSCR